MIHYKPIAVCYGRRWNKRRRVTVTYAAVSNNDSASEGSVPLGASATAHTLTGLQPLTNYNISVIATNNVGSSIPESITVVTNSVGEWQLLSPCLI